MRGGRVSREIELLERDDEVDLVSAQLAAAADGTGCVIWIEGPPGVGKTSLLDVAAHRACEHKMLVLRATGHGAADLRPSL